MNALISHRIASLIGIPVLCTTFPLSFSPAPTAEAASNTTQACPKCSECIEYADALTPRLALASELDSLDSAPTIIRSTGAIEGDIDVFRALLGGGNNGAAVGDQQGGRREINWDGVPAAVTNVPTFPPDFFNVNSPRGLIYDQPLGTLQVSNQSFTDVNAAYAGEFIPFSGGKTFSSIGSNQTHLRFAVAGSTTKAAVRGIGIVFVDVDKIGQTAIELVGKGGAKLGTFTVPVRSDRRGSSFLGIVFRRPVIQEVHIVAGDGALAANAIDVSNGGQQDLVVMDDFLYGEPTATSN